jgi:hypothetical protein
MECDVLLQIKTRNTPPQNEVGLNFSTWFSASKPSQGAAFNLTHTLSTDLISFQLSVDRVYELDRHLSQLHDTCPHQHLLDTILDIDIILTYAPCFTPVGVQRNGPLLLPPMLIQQYDISLEIADHLDLASIQRLSSTLQASHLLRVATSRVLQLFSVYFENPLDFGLCLKTTGAVVSGSAALSVLMGAQNIQWKANDLDIVVLDTYAPVMQRFLETNHYHIVRPSTPLRAPIIAAQADGDPDVITYPDTFKYIKFVRGLHAIDLCVCTRTGQPSVIDFVLSYHSTIVMNFISWNEVGSLFPNTTFHNLNLINRYTLDEARAEIAIAKYRRRGYRTVQLLASDRHRWAQCIVSRDNPPTPNLTLNNIRQPWLQKIHIVPHCT